MRNGIRQRMTITAAGACVLALAVCSFNCSDKPLEPVAPTWEMQMTAPISIKSYTLAELTAKVSGLLANTPGTKEPLDRPTFQADPSSAGGRSRFGGVSSPLSFSLTGGLFADTVSIGDAPGSSQGHTFVDTQNVGKINGMKVHVVVDNAIPLQVALELKFLDGAKQLLIAIPQSAGDSIIVSAPAVTGGTVHSPSHTERVIQLADTELQQFNSAYSLAYFLQISAPGTGVVLESTATIKIRIWAEFSYQVNK
jgi:hypothetical protein